MFREAMTSASNSARSVIRTNIYLKLNRHALSRAISIITASELITINKARRRREPGIISNRNRFQTARLRVYYSASVLRALENFGRFFARLRGSGGENFANVL